MSNEKSHESSPLADLNTKKHVSTSVYMHSNEMMALVKELYEHWREDPNTDLIGDRSYFYYSGLLTYDAAAFIEIMNMELGLDLEFDSGKEQEICFTILNALRNKRGAPTLAKTF